MNSLSFEEIIRTYIQLPARPTGSGWYALRCRVCDDHKYKKRGGWKFDGGVVAYNCFNCGAKAVYDPEDGRVSKEMKQILEAYDVPKSEVDKLALTNLKKSRNTNKDKSLTRNKKRDDVKTVKEIPLPSHFYSLGTKENDIWAEVAKEYLLVDRGIPSTEYPFYLSTDKAWKGRLIIPCYKDGKLIFYQGRDLTENPKRVKYLSVSQPREVIFYGYEEVEKDTTDPLYVVEGFFDAYSIGGIATLSNIMSEEQIKVLQRCPRPKVIIPDRRGDGHKQALQALDLGWSVSLPDIGDCKDVNEAVVKYGKLYVLKSIVDNTATGVLGRTKVNLLCKKTKRVNNGKNKKG